MSCIELGLEKGYIEKEPSEDEKLEVFTVYPRRIPYSHVLHSIINEFRNLGYSVDYDSKKRIYLVNNLNQLKKKNSEVTEQFLKIEDEITSNGLYEQLKSELVGSILAVSHITEEKPELVTDVFLSVLHRDINAYMTTSDYRKLCKLCTTGEKLLRELDEYIRSEQNGEG